MKRAAGAEPGASGGAHFISGKTLGIIGGASGATVARILIAESNNEEEMREFRQQQEVHVQER
jgi:hypothetical protein